MKLVMLNPNTSSRMTDAMVLALRGALPTSVELVGMTAARGVPVIDTAERFAIGAATALDMLAEVPPDADAILLACFGDPGLLSLRRQAAVPVIGMAEAAARAARRAGQRFAIVTAGSGWVPLLRDAMRALEADDLLVDVYALPGNGADLQRDPAAFRDGVAALSRQAADDGARALVLGGAAFSGLDFAIDARLQRIDVMNAIADALSLLGSDG